MVLRKEENKAGNMPAVETDLCIAGCCGYLFTLCLPSRGLLCMDLLDPVDFSSAHWAVLCLASKFLSTLGCPNAQTVQIARAVATICVASEVGRDRHAMLKLEALTRYVGMIIDHRALCRSCMFSIRSIGSN